MSEIISHSSKIILIICTKSISLFNFKIFGLDVRLKIVGINILQYFLVRTYNSKYCQNGSMITETLKSFSDSDSVLLNWFQGNTEQLPCLAQIQYLPLLMMNRHDRYQRLIVTSYKYIISYIKNEATSLYFWVHILLQLDICNVTCVAREI